MTQAQALANIVVRSVEGPIPSVAFTPPPSPVATIAVERFYPPITTKPARLAG